MSGRMRMGGEVVVMRNVKHDPGPRMYWTKQEVSPAKGIIAQGFEGSHIIPLKKPRNDGWDGR
jgi:hypothetical protein